MSRPVQSWSLEEATAAIDPRDRIIRMLARYAEHHEDCDALKYRGNPARRWRSCDCGLSELLREADRVLLERDRESAT